MQKINQKGLIEFAVVFVWVAVFGVILYIFVASIFSFERPIYTLLYKKPSSLAFSNANLIIEGESLATTSGTLVFTDYRASKDKSLGLLENLELTKDIPKINNSGEVVVRVKGEVCSIYPILVLKVNDKELFREQVSTNDWREYSVRLIKNEIVSKFSLSFINDYKDEICDRNLFIDYILFR